MSSSAHEVAIRMAEAVRELNHLTLWAELSGPADVYDALGALGTGAERLPQSCEQLGRQLERWVAARRLQRSGDGSVTVAVGLAFEYLHFAAASANDLAHWLQEAQAAISDLSLREDGDAS
jgi:hypothetical protein